MLTILFNGALQVPNELFEENGVLNYVGLEILHIFALLGIEQGLD